MYVGMLMTGFYFFTGGFLKMSSGGLKPISIASPSPSLMGGAVGGVTTPSNSQQNSTNNDAKRDNPFLQFVANTRYCNIICGCGS